MKLQKPTSASATIGITSVAGGIGGAMLGKGAMSFVPDTTTPTVMKAYRGAAVALGVLGMIAINGTDTLANLSKGASFGLALTQGLQLASDMMPEATKAKLKASEETSAVSKFALNALNCPCQDNAMQLGKPNHRRRALREPFDVSRFYQPQYVQSNLPASTLESVFA